VQIHGFPKVSPLAREEKRLREPLTFQPAEDGGVRNLHVRIVSAVAAIGPALDVDINWRCFFKTHVL
jgi:hypothetical protein